MRHLSDPAFWIAHVVWETFPVKRATNRAHYRVWLLDISVKEWKPPFLMIEVRDGPNVAEFYTRLSLVCRSDLASVN